MRARLYIRYNINNITVNSQKCQSYYFVPYSYCDTLSINWIVGDIIGHQRATGATFVQKYLLSDEIGLALVRRLRNIVFNEMDTSLRSCPAFFRHSGIPSYETSDVQCGSGNANKQTVRQSLPMPARPAGLPL